MPAIKQVEAFPLRLPRNLTQSTGTAGSPAKPGQRAGDYYWSSTFPTLYSPNLESTLIRVTLDDGSYGWGEAQAPLGPRVSATIVTDLLAPVLVGQPFAGTTGEIEVLWQRMFQTMRVRGQTGGFMMDAISGVDIALWDLAGKRMQSSVAQMIAAAATANGAGSGARGRAAEDWSHVPAYLSGLSGVDVDSRLEFARFHVDEGINLIKLFHESTPEQLLQTLDALRELPVRCAVDALWRLEWPAHRPFIQQLAARNLHWLEAPFYPDEPEPHRTLAQEIDVPMALGESYRTLREMSWFLDEPLVRFVQPDLGRSGITESLRIAEALDGKAVQMVPHVSIAFGPQIAAAVHLSAALPQSRLCEFNPTVFSVSNRFLRQPLVFEEGQYVVPTVPGLGIEVDLDELLRQRLTWSS